MDWQSQIAVDSGRGFAADASVSERLLFLRKTYMLVLAGLAVAGLAGYLGATRLLPTVANNWWIFFIAYMVAGFGARAVSRKPVINYLALFGLTILAGLLLGPLLAYATALGGGKPVIVMQALVITGLIVTGLSGYVLMTKKDFSYLRGALTIGTFALLGLIIVGFFWSSFNFHLMFSFFGAILFAGYVLYDTSRIVRTHPVNDHVGAAIDLFLDFFLLFLYILRILTMLSGRD